MKKTKQTSPPPRPLAARICGCGCENEFQPGRKDQIYMNKQHADFGYNHLIRKFKDAEKIKYVKILTKNDRILEKHYLAFKRKGVFPIVFFDILLADGFDFSAYVGMTEKDKTDYHFTFRYYIHISVNEPKRVKIFKR